MSSASILITSSTDYEPSRLSSLSSSSSTSSSSTSSSSAVIDFVAGGISGTAAKLIEYPADTVKTRMQSGFYEGKNALQVCRDIIRKEGAMRGFYSGVAMPVVGCAAECAVAFSVFNYTTDFLVNSPLFAAFAFHKNKDEHSYDVVGLSAAMSGVANGFLLTPVEVVKCRCQTNPKKYPDVRQCVKVSVRDEGWKCLTSGVGGTLAREIPGSIGFFLTIELVMKNIFSQYRMTHEEVRLLHLQAQQQQLQQQLQPVLHHHHAHHEQHHESFVIPGELKENTPWYVRPICGGLAGFGLVGLPFPADTVKTVMQITPEYAKMGFVATGRDLVKKSGWKVLFRGMPITMLRAFPANAAVFSTYDLASSYLSKIS